MLSNEVVRRLCNKPVRVEGPLPPGRYVAEPKYDGERELVEVGEGAIVMANRYASVYERSDLPRLFALMERALPPGLFDAELVVPGGSVYDVMRAVRNGEDGGLVLMVFDVLFLDGQDVRARPLSERKALLEREVEENAGVRLVPYGYISHREVGAVFEECVRRGFEGVVVKTDGPYSARWYKLKKAETVDLVVLGFRKTKEWEEDRIPMSFLVGYYDGSKYVPVCYVSSGLSWSTKEAIGRFFLEKGLVRGEDREVVYVEPLLVLEIEFQERSKEGKLRHPRIKRIRWDKAPEECRSFRGRR